MVKQISVDLGLNYEEQDWGIINSDPQRVKEFIEYFLSESDLSFEDKYQVLELIIASFNDAIINSLVDTDLDGLFSSFISNIDLSHPVLVYWKSVQDEEFPVAKYW